MITLQTIERKSLTPTQWYQLRKYKVQITNEMHWKVTEPAFIHVPTTVEIDIKNIEPYKAVTASDFLIKTMIEFSLLLIFIHVRRGLGLKRWKMTHCKDQPATRELPLAGLEPRVFRSIALRVTSLPQSQPVLAVMITIKYKDIWIEWDEYIQYNIYKNTDT